MSISAPDFATLEALSGHPELRMVNGVWMDREEYTTCQWHVVREYALDNGQTGRYWKATLDGLQRYGALIHERREQRFAAARERREADDSYSDEINSMLDDAKPSYRK